MSISANTKAVLLLTAPLIVSRERSSVELLTHSEYNRLARILSENYYEPADLLSPEAEEIFNKLKGVMEKSRLTGLLRRGFLLSQAIDKWQSRSIWVISRADAEYPGRLKERLKDASPELLYGCGDNNLLNAGGLAVVGSRNVDESLIQYTECIGRQAAGFAATVISGGAKGIDRAAMFGSLQAGGRVVGVLSDNLERLALARDNREYLKEKKLVLVSPYDPAAGFDVGHAMQRNKIIYALSDAALVVNSDYERGGTWAGAVEQLEKLHLVPVYIRYEADNGKGLKALRQKGALAWPNPESQEEFVKALAVRASPVKSNLLQKELPLTPRNFTEWNPEEEVGNKEAGIAEPDITGGLQAEEDKPEQILQAEFIREKSSQDTPDNLYKSTITPANELFSRVKEIIIKMKMPKTDIEIAEELQVSQNQTRVWLRRLVNEGVLKKQHKPAGYVLVPERQEKLINNI